MTFTLAHLSDPHVGPLVQMRWRELMGKRMSGYKRLTGYWNWKQHRQTIHDMQVLAAVVADVSAQSPDHIALSGDLVNLGMQGEFPVAHEHLKALGGPEFVSIVPGNHDAYVRGSLDMMHATFGAHMLGDDGGDQFPYVRKRGPLALVGVCSAIPTAPFIADGELGTAQSARLAALLPELRAAHAGVVIMIHHPPHRGGAALFRGLRDAVRFEHILHQHGADLVVHGHNHKYSLAYRPGPNGTRVPIVGVASASAVPGDPAHCAAYHLFRFTQDASGRLAIHMDVRGKRTAHGPISTMSQIEL